MDVAEPVLRALGARLGSAARGHRRARATTTPAFVRPWVRARNGSLGVDAPIPLDATPALARLTSWLAPARVRVGYPGVWLGGSRLGHARALPRPPPAARGRLRRRPRAARPPAARRGDAGRLRARGGPSATRVEALLTRWLPRPLAELLRRGRRAAARRRRCRAARGARSAAASRRSRSARSARRCAARASPRWRASSTGSGCRRRLGGLRARPSLRTAGRRRPARAGAARAASPRIANTRLLGLRAAARCTTSRRRTRTGPAARSGWPTRGEPEAIGLLDHLDAAPFTRRP